MSLPKKILRFEAMEDRCMLSIDSGMGAFAFDAEYGPQKDMDLTGIYEEGTVFDQETSPTIYTVARFEESTLYRAMVMEFALKEGLELPSFIASSSPFDTPQIHTITTIHDTAKENGSETLQYKIQLVCWGGSPNPADMMAFPLYNCHFSITSNIAESFTVRTTQTLLKPNAAPIVTTYTLSSGQMGKLQYRTWSSDLDPVTWRPIAVLYSPMTVEIIPNDNKSPYPNPWNVEAKVYNHFDWYNQPLGQEAYVSATGTIKDNDHWVISSSVMDEEALEPCTWLPVDDRIASYYVSKTPGDAYCTDNSYPITVEFALGGTAEGSSWGSADKKDYQLFVGDRSNWNNSSSYIALTTTNGKTTGKITILEGQPGVTINLIAMTDSLFESDETASLTVTKAYAVANPKPQDCFQIGETGDIVTILQAPEFISDRDDDPLPIRIPINSDYWNLPKRYEKMDVGTIVIEELSCVKNRPVRYSIIEGNDNNQFDVNELTGEIKFASIPELPIGHGNLKVRVYDSNKPQLYDEAWVYYEFDCLAVFTVSAYGTANITNFLTEGNTNFGHSNWQLTIHNTFEEGDLDAGCYGQTSEERQLLNYFGFRHPMLGGVLSRIWGYFPESGHSLDELAVGVPGHLAYENSLYATAHSIYIWEHDTITDILNFTKNTYEDPGQYYLRTHNCTHVAIEAATLAGLPFPETFLPSVLVNNILLHEDECDFCW